MDERYTPAVKAMLDARIQARTISTSPCSPNGKPCAKPRKTPSTRIRPEKEKPPCGARLGGHHRGTIERGLLDRVNGNVHDNWVGGILPPIRSHKHDAALDLVRQERTTHRNQDQQPRTGSMPLRPGMGRPSIRCGRKLRRASPARRRRLPGHVGRGGCRRSARERPPAESGRQEQHWANLNGRINHTSGVVKPPKTTRKKTRIPGTAKTPIAEKPIRKELVVHVEGRLLDSGIPMDTRPTPDGDRLLGRCSRDIGFISRMSDIADEAALDFIHGRYDPDVTLGRIRDEVGGIAQGMPRDVWRGLQRPYRRGRTIGP